LRDAFTQSLPQDANLLLGTLGPKWIERFWGDWPTFSHPHQEPPQTAPGGDPWTTWLILGGRGAGKTRAGAEWVRRVVREGRARRIALVGETEHDVREVMVEGISGLIAVSQRAERPVWIPSRRRLEWPNGAVAYAFSAEDPDSLRGPQFDAAWCDELAKWRHAEATFDMLQFGLRLGAEPRQVITTTPRPIPLIKRLLADPRTAVTRAKSYANQYHLSAAFFDHVLARYKDTRLGRQEIDGEIIDERPDALWTRVQLEACRVATAPALARIVVAVDPPAAARAGSTCGVIAAGRNENGTLYVLADASASGLSPAAWAAKAIALWRQLEADALIAEVNHGGDMVRQVIAEVDATVPVTAVRATRGKWLRAEPIAALYEQGRVKHVGSFPALEDEMCDFSLDGLSDGRSPDRLDALVWALTALSFGVRHPPRVRML
jgi:phage terminase large subunit-like protein